jgi:hypothetical protein
VKAGRTPDEAAYSATDLPRWQSRRNPEKVLHCGNSILIGWGYADSKPGFSFIVRQESGLDVFSVKLQQAMVA